MIKIGVLNNLVIAAMTPDEWRAIQPTPATLNIPHFSQRGPGADARRNDCGAACITMIVNGLTDRSFTVDDIALKFQDRPNRYMSMRTIISALRFYGLKSEYKRPLTPDKIKEAIQSGNPVIALVKYSAMPQKFAKFNGSHFIVIYSISNTERFLYRDPLANNNTPLSMTADQLSRTMSVFEKDENLPHQGLVIKGATHE